MRQLPLYTVLVLVVGILLWNFSFYRHYYEVQAASVTDRGIAPLYSLEGHGRTHRASSTSKLASWSGRMESRPVSTAGLAGGGRRVPLSRTRVPQTPTREEQRAGHGTSVIITGLERVSESYDSGVARVLGWRNGSVRDSRWSTYSEDGQILSDGDYSEDLREGSWTYWYEEGQVKHVGEYRAGRRWGFWESWHADGTSQSSGSYEDGGREGNWCLWYTNGQVMERGRYEDGLREGSWEFYDYHGRVDRRTGQYAAGRRIDR